MLGPMGSKHCKSVASGIQIVRSSRLPVTSGIDARGTRKDDREERDARGMCPERSCRSAHAGSERAAVLDRVKGTLDKLAGYAALDAPCARQLGETTSQRLLQSGSALAAE